MKLLAIETATDACSAALWCDGDLLDRFEHAPREHSRLILPMLEQLLAEAGIRMTHVDALAYGCGPGSFTGVRIAAGVVQGLALARDLPVVGVSSLQALALGCLDAHECARVLTAFDARMGEVYWAAWRRGADGLPEAMGEEQVAAPATVRVSSDHQPWCGAGGGWSAHGAALEAALGVPLAAVEAERLPHAREVARLALPLARAGRGVDASQALPRYVRDSVAHKPGQAR